LPDEIWVGDRIAEELAEKTFAGVRIRLVENPYFQDIREDLARFSKTAAPAPEGLRVLYVCEPVREHARVLHGNERHLGYVEEEAIRYFLSNIAVLGQPIDTIVIRPHPAEPANKYEWVRGEVNLPIKMGGAKPLIEEILQCDIVVGCESMAMVVGLMAGKRVISCIPPGGRACHLPHPEIQHLACLL
jgi:hypothetical protein